MRTGWIAVVLMERLAVSAAWPAIQTRSRSVVG